MVNHILTFGLDILWRRRAVKIAASAGGTLWADMCSGTGETAAYLRRIAPAGTNVLSVDFSLDMLGVAKQKPEAADITFVASDITTLPFPDNSFDLITMSFATRNINLNKDSLIRSFAEYHRVLKPGGRFVNLETSRPPFAPVREAMHLYIKLFVKMIGAGVSGSKAGYAYLAKTIPRFYAAEDLADIMRTAGFSKVTYRHLLFGVAAIHQAYKHPELYQGGT